MPEHYIYKGAPPERVFGALPEGDYGYIIAECDPPYWKNDKWILSVKLIIEPSKIYVWANPWSGKTSSGEERDGIGELLCSCNRAPKPGTSPNWKAVVGARGRLRLKVEIAQMGTLAGKEVNKVHYFYRPKELEQQVPQTYPEAEIKKAAKDVQAAAQSGAIDPETQRPYEEPDDIPF